jgi:hypothetical protein
MIKSRILKWAGHVKRVREKNSYRVSMSISDKEASYNLRLYVALS